MALPLTDTFTGTDGDPLNATNHPSVGSGIDINGNRARCISPASAYGGTSFTSNSDTAVLDYDCYIDMPDLDAGTLSRENYVRFMVGPRGYDYESGNYYEWNIEATHNVNLRNGGSNIASITMPSYTAGDDVHFRFYASGQDFKAKVWLNGASEPGTWTMEYTDAGAYAGTPHNLVTEVKTGGSGTASTFYFDNLVFDVASGGPPVDDPDVPLLNQPHPHQLNVYRM